MAGVSVRTIRYYINEGLLPAPETKGRYASYNQEYLARLELIRRLKAAFLPLKEIRERITNLNANEVKDLLAKMDKESSASRQPSHQVRESKSVSSALEYINQVLETQNKTAPLSHHRIEASPPLKAQIPDKILFHSMNETQPEAYQRFIIAPGVELHIRQLSGTPLPNRIQRLLEFAKSLFE